MNEIVHVLLIQPFTTQQFICFTLKIVYLRKLSSLAELETMTCTSTGTTKARMCHVPPHTRRCQISTVKGPFE